MKPNRKDSLMTITKAHLEDSISKGLDISKSQASDIIEGSITCFLKKCHFGQRMWKITSL